MNLRQYFYYDESVLTVFKRISENEEKGLVSVILKAVGRKHDVRKNYWYRSEVYPDSRYKDRDDALKRLARDFDGLSPDNCEDYIGRHFELIYRQGDDGYSDYFYVAGTAEPLYTKVCKNCGEVFKTDNDQKQYCSEYCRRTQSNIRHKERIKKAKAGKLTVFDKGFFASYGR